MPNNGDIVHWTVALNNIGNYEAKNVTLFDILPINTHLVRAIHPKQVALGLLQTL